MKKNWHLFGIGFSLIFGTVFWQQTASAPNEKLTTLSRKLAGIEANEATVLNTEKARPTITSATRKQLTKADSLIKIGLKRIGTPYVYAGMSDSGFDCSGFVSFVFSRIGIEVPHSSKMQAETGLPVAREHARKGDIVIFTGTNPADRTPGHVGIIISNPGEVMSFVHSSSNGGVKISEVETTNYEKRFLEIRRVL